MHFVTMTHFAICFRHKVFGNNYLIVSSADILMECVIVFDSFFYFLLNGFASKYCVIDGSRAC